MFKTAQTEEGHSTEGRRLSVGAHRKKKPYRHIHLGRSAEGKRGMDELVPRVGRDSRTSTRGERRESRKKEKGVLQISKKSGPEMASDGAVRPGAGRK